MPEGLSFSAWPARLEPRHLSLVHRSFVNPPATMPDSGLLIPTMTFSQVAYLMRAHGTVSSTWDPRLLSMNPVVTARPEPTLPHHTLLDGSTPVPEWPYGNIWFDQTGTSALLLDHSYVDDRSGRTHISLNATQSFPRPTRVVTYERPDERQMTEEEDAQAISFNHHLHLLQAVQQSLLSRIQQRFRELFPGMSVNGGTQAGLGPHTRELLQENPSLLAIFDTFLTLAQVWSLD